MKENYHIALLSATDRVILVPYRRHHVLKYHKWMCDPDLLEATASEPLSLEEEYAMQRTWRDDPRKITFIVEIGNSLLQELGPQMLKGELEELRDSAEEIAPNGDSSKAASAVAGGSAPAQEGSHPASCSSEADKTSDQSSADSDQETRRMVGDVNLFLHDRDDPFNAEIEVMIAEKAFLRRGIAREALLMLMLYGVQSLGITRYFAKISEDNTASLALFRSLGFIDVNYVSAFREYELAVDVKKENAEESIASWEAQAKGPFARQKYADLPFVSPLASAAE